MIAGGASLAPRRWSLPELAMAARSSPARLCTPFRVAARKTRNCRFFSGVAPGSRRLRPSESISDQLQCLPLPLMPANGFSCRSSVRSWRRATRPIVSITI